MIVRSMRPEELDSVLTVFEYYRDSAGIDDDDYDQDRVLGTVKEYCIRPNLFFKIALDNNRPVGIVGGFLSPDPVERELTATIQFLFLIQGYDNLDNYDQLLTEFSAWAKQCGARAVRAIDIGKNITRLNSIYSELGYRPISVSIMNKEIQ